MKFLYDLFIGTASTIQKIGYRDIQYAHEKPNQYIIINTLPESEQDYLIKNTIACNHEENVINKYLKEHIEINIIIYGKNATDETAITKGQQLSALGFTNIYIYIGGLFEWALLQEIYDFENFPTTTKLSDPLRFQPANKFNIQLISY